VLLLLALGSATAFPGLAQRQLSWRPLAVEARLEADGSLWVRESHTMVFTGDWNGGERSFRLRADQTVELLSLSRFDSTTGETVRLARGGLGQVDHYEWADRFRLRWRSRLPSDPPFEETAITYLIEYRQEQVLRPRGDLYLLDHDFAFPDRIWPIYGYTLSFDLNPVWQPTVAVAGQHGPLDLSAGEGYVLSAELNYLGKGAPSAARRLPPAWLRAVPFAGAVLVIAWLVFQFWRREAELGRFDPLPVPAQLDTEWLEEHLFDLSPEEVGALWDRNVGPAEVAAILARWEAEGRITSEIVPRPGLFKRDLMRLELTAERNSFEGYEGKLMRKLFFAGRETTDTEVIRKHYRTRGFDPAGTIRRGLERRLEKRGKELRRHATLPGNHRRVTQRLFLTFLLLMGVEAIQRPLPTLQLTLLLIPPLVALYLLLGLIFAMVYRGRLAHLAGWSLGFGLPALAFSAVMAGAVFFDLLLPNLDFTPQPGIAGSSGLAALAVMVWSSLLNVARSRERQGGLARRRRLAAARWLFARELGSRQPEMLDAWMPYLLALGLGTRVDHWWRKYGGLTEAEPSTTSSRFGSSGSTVAGGSWTGGGGSFGGAGATVSWAAVAGGLASGLAKPGSSGGSSGGGGGGGGGSSGGGGGGGW
jgi:uncharacterized membrane protein YgcG